MRDAGTPEGRREGAQNTEASSQSPSVEVEASQSQRPATSVRDGRNYAPHLAAPHPGICYCYRIQLKPPGLDSSVAYFYTSGSPAVPHEGPRDTTTTKVEGGRGRCRSKRRRMAFCGVTQLITGQQPTTRPRQRMPDRATCGFTRKPIYTRQKMGWKVQTYQTLGRRRCSSLGGSATTVAVAAAATSRHCQNPEPDCLLLRHCDAATDSFGHIPRLSTTLLSVHLVSTSIVSRFCSSCNSVLGTGRR